MEAVAIVGSDETEVQVSFIMIDRSTSRKATNHLDSFLPDIGLVNFLQGILVFANNDGGFVDIKEKIAVVGRNVLQYVFLHGQVEHGVGNALVIYKFHRFSSIIRACSRCFLRIGSCLSAKAFTSLSFDREEARSKILIVRS